MQRVILFLVLMCVSLSVHAQLNLRDIRISSQEGYCIDKWGEYSEIYIIDESERNRRQHVMAHCSIQKMSVFAGMTPLMSHFVASSIMAAKEYLYDDKPNVEEMTVGASWKVGREWFVSYAQTLDMEYRYILFVRYY